MRARLAILSAAVLAVALAAGPARAQETKCDSDRPIVFGGLDWDSNAFHTALAQQILSRGYGCKVDTVPGTTIPLINGLARGDVQVLMEIWQSNQPEVWVKALAEGKVSEAGVNFPDAIQGWFVPRYLVEGSGARAAGLKSVADLPKFKEVFRDPEEPAKGRFYNCVAGWACEVVNAKKLHAYGLEAHYVNFRPGTGAALSAAVESAIRRKQPVLFYYWGPTWLLGKVGKDVVMLEEPPYEEATWKALMAAKEAKEVTKSTAYPVVKVVVGVNSEFAKRSPTVVKFLDAYETTGQMVSDALAYMQDSGGKADDAAKHFLKTNEAIWTKWVPADVAARVKASL